MPRQDIFTGTFPNDGTGDVTRAAWIKANANFVEIYMKSFGTETPDVAGESLFERVVRIDEAASTHTHSWSSITGKPTTFTPSAHTHAWDSVSGKPVTFPPDAHVHTWESVTGKPTTFTPADHSHTWESVTGKPATFTATEHAHTWESVTGKPLTFPPEAHAHTWDSITGKPTTFAPEDHAHTWATITGKPTTFPPEDHAHTWESVTGKPTTFAPSAHTHAASEVTNLPWEMIVSISDETTNLEAGVDKVSFVVPRSVTLTAAWLCSNAAPTGSAIIVNVRKNGTTIFTTKPEVASGATLGTNAVLSDTSLMAQDRILVDLDQVGSTTPGTGAKLILIGYYQ